MDENKNQTNVVTDEKNDQSKKSNLTYDDQVIKKIAGMAVAEIPGILGLSGSLINELADRFRSTEDITKGVDAEVGTKQVALDLDVICEYGKNIPEVFDEAFNKVKDMIKRMTGLEVVEFNMHVNDIMTKESYEGNNKSKDDDDAKKKDTDTPKENRVQ